MIERAPEMPRRFEMAFITLMTQFGRTLDEDLTEVRAAWSVLHDIPLPLLDLAMQRAVRTRRFFPRIAELREDAEKSRQEVIAAEPWRPCADCRELNGFVEITDTEGVQRLKICDCRARYQQRMSGLGVPLRPLLQLEAPAEERAS